MEDKIDKLTKILKESNNVVFFEGAGVSTDTEHKLFIFIQTKSA